jgi:hypothetical protein
MMAFASRTEKAMMAEVSDNGPLSLFRLAANAPPLSQTATAFARLFSDPAGSGIRQFGAFDRDGQVDDPGKRCGEQFVQDRQEGGLVRGTASQLGSTG